MGCSNQTKDMLEERASLLTENYRLNLIILDAYEMITRMMVQMKKQNLFISEDIENFVEKLIEELEKKHNEEK